MGMLPIGVVESISMLLDPPLRVELEPLQPYLRVAGLEQAQLKVTDLSSLLPFARHTHVFTKLTTQPCHGEVKQCRRQDERELIRQA